MASHCYILAWEITWTEEPDGLQSMGLQSQIQLSAQHSTSIVSICHICQSQCPNSSHSSFPLLVSMWCSLGWCLYFCFAVSSSLPFFLDSTYKWCYTVFVFLFLIYFILHNNPISNPKRWCCESAAFNMPTNLENSAVATGLEKVRFHSNPKERQCQRMFKLPHNYTHLTR